MKSLSISHLTLLGQCLILSIFILHSSLPLVNAAPNPWPANNADDVDLELDTTININIANGDCHADPPYDNLGCFNPEYPLCCKPFLYVAPVCCVREPILTECYNAPYSHNKDPDPSNKNENLVGVQRLPDWMYKYCLPASPLG
ncbi:hypothetical protein DFH27DRAFT_567349 [Peziza echinospora]|nr:hypothetical protein DFH27DRAFT_567349 [Peziza echinospora]